MSFRRPSISPIRFCLLAVVALSGAAAAGACSLNPQPIPPGFDPDASTLPAPGNSNNKGDDTPDGSFADASAGGHAADAADDSAPVPPPRDASADAADAGDAGDGSADAKDEG